MYTNCKECGKQVRKRNAYHAPIESLTARKITKPRKKSVVNTIQMTYNYELMDHEALSNKFNNINDFYCSSDCFVLDNVKSLATKNYKRSQRRKKVYAKCSRRS